MLPKPALVELPQGKRNALEVGPLWVDPNSVEWVRGCEPPSLTEVRVAGITHCTTLSANEVARLVNCERLNPNHAG